MTGTVLSAGNTAVYTNPCSPEAFILVGEDRQKEIGKESSADKCYEEAKSKVKWIDHWYESRSAII